MKLSEIVVGAIYEIKDARSQGPARLPRRVVSYNPKGYLSGGNVRVALVRPNATEGQPETWAGNYFIEQAVKQIIREAT